MGAFLALARHAPNLQGSVEIIGTPAEEGGGGKIKLMQAGVFEGVDAAMMFHPFDRDILAHPALCSMRIAMTYQGVPLTRLPRLTLKKRADRMLGDIPAD